jgi:hypothetical protein
MIQEEDSFFFRSGSNASFIQLRKISRDFFEKKIREIFGGEDDGEDGAQ